MLHKCGYPLVCGDLVAMEEALKELLALFCGGMVGFTYI